MPQPVSYNPGTPVSGSIQENNISYVVDGQQRDYRGGFGGLSWMSEVPAANNVIFIGNSVSLGRGPANIPLFYPSYNNSAANIIYTANTLPGSPRNFTTTGSAYNWAATNNFFINNSDNPIPRIDADGLVLYLDANQPTSYPQTGTTWYDMSGFGSSQALYNNPPFSTDGYLDFSTNEYSTRSGGGTLTLGDNYTISATVNILNSTAGYRTLVRTLPDDHPIIINTNTNSLGYYANGDGEFLDSGYTITAGIWMRIDAVGTNGTQQQFYINGNAVGSPVSSTSGKNATGMTWDAFGNVNGGSQPFGKVSNAVVYNKALTESEIKQNYFQSNIVQDGLVLMADASNLVSYPKSGTTAYNLTGSLTGSLLNGVGFSQENGGNWTFDGVDDRISFQSPFGDIDWGTTAFTVMGWIKVDSPNDNDWCLLSSATNSNLIFGTLPYPAANALYVYGLRNSLGSPNNQVFNFFASNVWPNGYFRDTWLHVTLTYNGNGLSLGNFAIYSNGISRTLGNGGGAGYANANVIQLGRSTYGTGPTEYPNLMVYNRALTSDEVQQNYQATKDKFLGQNIVTNGLVLNLDAANKDSYARSLPPLEVLVVAGGGGGSGNFYDDGAGGGAGGLIYNSAFQLTNGTATTVTVGAGGVASSGGQGGNGGDSVFGSLTATGGGGGAAHRGAGVPGGSGGGGCGSFVGDNFNVAGGPGTPGQGNRGGNGGIGDEPINGGGYPGSAGGGGAGSIGGAPTGGGNNQGGSGGNGLQLSISGTPTYYAGGGGGVRDGIGGLGGGGNASNGRNGSPAQAGTANTGGGGGGGRAFTGETGVPGPGGSGIVIVRYPGLPAATGGTVVSANGYTTHTFTTSGIFTPALWNDLSGNGNNATLTNGPSFLSNVNGGIINFDGVDDYASVPQSTSVNITTNTITFGGWCYPTISNKYQHILVKNVGESRQYGMWLSVNGTSQIFRNLNGVVSQDNVTISTPWVVNAWNYIMLVYNGSTIKIYLNGSEVFSENASGNIVTTNSNVNIGGEPTQPFFFNGQIAVAQIYNRALSATEITQNYNAQKTRFGL